MFVRKPCPTCHEDHGFSVWKVSESSAIKPLRCPHCKQNFHQPGLRLWIVLPLLFPSSMLAGLLTWAVALLVGGLSVGVMLGATAFLTVTLDLLLVSLWVNHRHPLRPGPRYG
jgi:hypothetical protein